MSLSEFELKKCEKAIAAFMKKRRPPPYIRKKLDLWCRIEEQSIDIFEIRPEWRNPENTIEIPVAKCTYVRTRGTWKVYWQRQDLKWHRYEPDPEVNSIEAFFELVDRDEYACFLVINTHNKCNQFSHVGAGAQRIARRFWCMAF